MNAASQTELSKLQSRPTTLRTGAHVLLDALVEGGVDTIFGYPGGAVLPLYDAMFADLRLRHILMRHEQAAVHAAEGYARSTGRVGVVLVTSGPGVANTISGLLDALSDSIPVLCISGQVSTKMIGTDAFQECDAIGISRPVTKWNVQMREGADISATVLRGISVALEGRPGPVLIDFPKDLQLQTASAAVNVRSAPTSDVPVPLTQRPGRIRRAVEMIAEARRPIIYGGGGLINSGDRACLEFAKFVKLIGAPCTLTLMGLGALPASDERYLGMLGMHGTLEANLAMHHSDLVICVGARFDDRVTGAVAQFCPEAKIIHIDIDAASINKIVRADFPMVGDCGAILAAMNAEWLRQAPPQRRIDAWWQKIAVWRDEDSMKVRDDDAIILPQVLMREVQKQITDWDCFVSTDVGQHQMWAAQHLRFERPRRWLTSGGAGTMGYGLPAALGAQIGNPNALVVCISGDASILMNIQELSSVAQHRAPLKVILANNGYMGMVRQWQELMHGGRYSHSYTDSLPDFVALARAFGWQSARVTDPSQLAAALAECLNSLEPYFLDVAVAPQENCFPMIPAGCGHHQIMLEQGRWYSPSTKEECVQ